MTNTTLGTTRVRTARRLTVAAATAACLVALPGAGIAQAQTNGAAASQYTVPTVTVPSSTVTTPSATVPSSTVTTPTATTPDTGVADNGGDTSTGDGSGDATDDSGSSNGNGGSSSSGSGTGTGTAGTGSGTGAGSTTTVQIPNLVDYAAFGTTDRKVRIEIRLALTQGGLRYRYMKTLDRTVVKYLESDFAKRLSPEGARAVGIRTAQELTGTGPFGATIFRTLFGTKFDFRPFTATVLSRGDNISAAQVAFLRGLATGFGGKPIPVVYVERSDDKRPHLDEFKNIPGVGIVDNIDKPAGKAELVRLLTQGGTVAPGANAGSDFAAQNQAAIANVGDDSSSSMPMILLALVVLGGALFTGGTLVRRRR